MTQDEDSKYQYHVQYSYDHKGKRMKKRVLSGIRATGRLHLGNYLGAIKGMLELQDHPEYEHLYMVADVHTLTTPYNVDELKINRVEVIKDYLAAGLDPEKCILFQQSEVNEHIELAFYFSSVVSIAKMQHLPTFKDKVKQHPDHATLALLNYPTLMSADILVYKAGLVPVGIDQEPHLEVSRVIARKMNQEYGTDFPEPQRFATKGEYIPSLTGEGKMSKTVDGSFLNLTDDLETIQNKVKKVPTDSGRGNKIGEAYIPEQTNFESVANVGEHKGVGTLMKFVELIQGVEQRDEYDKLYQSSGLRYSEVKHDLSVAIFELLQPIKEKRSSLSEEFVANVCVQGAQKAKAIAQITVQEVKEKMGLR